MNLINLVDTMIHSVPIMPGKLQGTWLDMLWDRIENSQKRKIQNMPTMEGELAKKNKQARAFQVDLSSITLFALFKNISETPMFSKDDARLPSVHSKY